MRTDKAYQGERKALPRYPIPLIGLPKKARVAAKMVSNTNEGVSILSCPKRFRA